MDGIITERKRDYFFDNVKFVMIVCVILGHTLAHLGRTRLGVAMDSWLYFFHMPVFIFVSGYFSKRSETRKFVESELKILETFFIFSLIHIAIRNTWSWRGFVFPQWSLWYLLSLIWFRAIIQVVGRVTVKWLAISVVISVLVGFIPIGGALSFQRTFAFLPFFFAGNYLKNNDALLAKIRRVNPYLAIAFLLILFIGVLLVDLPFKRLLELKFSYKTFTYPLVVSALLRMVLLLLCAFASISILRLIPRERTTWVSEQGSHTLLYYLYHTLIIIALELIEKKLYALPDGFAWNLLYMAINVFLIWSVTQIGFFRLLPNLFSYTKDRVCELLK